MGDNEDNLTIIPTKSGSEKEKTFDQEALENYYNETLGSADSQYTMRVKKERKGLKGMAHCFEYSPSDFTFTEMIEKTRVEYGAGDYRIYVQGPKGLMKLNQPFYIAERLTDAAKPVGENNALAGQLLTQNNELVGRFESLIKETNKPAFDWVQIMTLAPPVIAAITPFLPKRSQGPDPIELMRLVMEIKSEVGEGGSDDSMTAAITKAMEVFGPSLLDEGAKEDKTKQLYLEKENNFLKNRLAKIEQHLMGKLPPAAPKEQEASFTPATQPENEIKEDDQMGQLEKLKMMLSLCLKGARMESEPEDYAGLLIDQLDDKEIETLVNQLTTNEQWFMQLSMLNKEILEYPDWFEALMSSFVEFCTNEPELTDEDEEPSIIANKSDSGPVGNDNSDTTTTNGDT